MTDTPERIWAHGPTTFDGMDVWQTTPADHTTEYIRADLARPIAEAEDTIAVQSATIKSLVEALECIDSDLESRNFLENSSLRDTTRAALAGFTVSDKPIDEIVKVKDE